MIGVGHGHHVLGEAFSALRGDVKAIGDDVVHGRQSAAPGAPQPAHLQRRRLAGEHGLAVVLHVPGQMDQNVDLIVADARGQGVVVHLGHAAPVIRGSAEGCGEVVGEGMARIAERLHRLAVVAFQHRAQKQSDRMAVEGRSQVTDAKAALGVGHVGMGGRRFRAIVDLTETPVLGMHFRRVQARQVMERQEKVAVNMGGRRHRRKSPAQDLNRLGGTTLLA